MTEGPDAAGAGIAGAGVTEGAGVTKGPSAAGPGVAGAAGRRAAVAETHISTLFFYGDRVLKVRKPVNYGFVDFADRERRREDCEREVVLNRRLAPDVYLGTAAVVVNGQPVEHAVVMRRLPADRTLEALVHREAPVDDEVARVATTLARFHRQAARSPTIDAAATASALWQRWQATEDGLSRFVGTVLDPVAYREVTTLAGRYLRGREALFAARIAAGGACDGHGDLQAADVFCLDDGPRLLDCLEFDDELRYGDVLADVAFLAADLEALGAPEAARLLVERYEAEAPTGAPPSLLHFYVASRAHVRMLVECLHAEEGLPHRSAPALLDLALDHLRRAGPRLVLIGGPPGAGKSTVAAWLGQALGAEVLATDHLRRSVAPHHYDEASRVAVYRTLADRAKRALAFGHDVVADATWAAAHHRAMATRAAADTSSAVLAVRCTAPAEARNDRMTTRGPGGESDATPAVAQALPEADPWPDAVPVDTSGTVADTRRALRAALEPVLHRTLAP